MSNNMTERLAALLAARKKALASAVEVEGEAATGMHGEAITYNKEQQQFVNLLASGQSCVLIGAAGTGKTTCTQGAITKLLHTGKVPVLEAGDHKHLVTGTPGIVIISYTRRAVNNIRKVLPADLKSNAVTAHKLLEYAPVYYEVFNEDTGTYKTIMKFEATRNALNPLPSTIHTIIVEESSMLGTELFKELQTALSHKVQWVFIGDIQQLPPVFGPAILGFALLKLPVVQLTQVYRQALESPIIRLAHQILAGNTIAAVQYPEWKHENQLTLHPWKKKVSAENATSVAAAFFKQAIDNGSYDTEEDMILLPFNKAFGTIELNKHIANHLARKRGAITYEVIAGFLKHYFSVGDKILYEKEDAEIISISKNMGYSGAMPQKASANLDYWGYNSDTPTPLDGIDDIDFFLAQIAAKETTEDRVNSCSHVITIKLSDSEKELSLSTAGEVNALLHAYALTVHKAQGSEWRKVFVVFHNSHATMISRELLYTAVTRAREELYVICEPETFTKGILSQRIKGDTLAEKAEHFKGKIDNSTAHYYSF